MQNFSVCKDNKIFRESMPMFEVYCRDFGLINENAINKKRRFVE